MRLRYAFYIILLFLISFSLFTYLGLSNLENKIDMEKSRLASDLRELKTKKERLAVLEKVVAEQRLKIYTDIEALEVMLSYVKKLKKDFGLKVVKYANKEGNLWSMDLILSFKAKDGKDISYRMKKLVTSKAPVVLLKEFSINTLSGDVKILISLKQPFVGK